MSVINKFKLLLFRFIQNLKKEDNILIHLCHWPEPMTVWERILKDFSSSIEKFVYNNLKYR